MSAAPIVPPDLLRALPVFSGLDAGDLGVLAGLAREVAFRKGEVIFRERDPGRELFLVLAGVVEITRKGVGDAAAVPLARLERGDLVGEISAFDGGTRSATASASVTPETRLAAWDAEAFRRFLEERPRAGVRLLSALLRQTGQRLRQTSEAVQALVRALA
jgi:CRP-like cAMP-binding protein